MKDIVERLRAIEDEIDLLESSDLLKEAAAEIERLRAEIDGLHYASIVDP